MHASEMLVAVLIPLGFFLMIFGIIYMYKRENLAMIEKGMNPKENRDRPAPYKNLKWGLLLIGAGAGLFLAYLLDNFILPSNQGFHGHDGNEAIYFSLIAIGGGLGLFGSYKMEKKWWEENKTKE
jgi:amino acid transporter